MFLVCLESMFSPEERFRDLKKLDQTGSRSIVPAVQFCGKPGNERENGEEDGEGTEEDELLAAREFVRRVAIPGGPTPDEHGQRGR